MRLQEMRAVTVSKNESPALLAPQRWKLWLFGGLAAAAALGLLFNDGIARVLDVDPLVVQLAILLPSFSIFGAALLSVRCPHCGLGLVAYAMSHQSAGHWLNWLLAVKNCPQCGKSAHQEDNGPTLR